MKIYHQCGYRDSWNLDSFNQDNCGSGIILSPKHRDSEKISKIPPESTALSIFDPQFFIPRIARGKLSTYPFFPEILSNGFQTTEYLESDSEESAQKCVEFQFENNFLYLVIPTRYRSGMPSDFTVSLEEMFVSKFIPEIKKQCPDKKILLQLLLNKDMLKDEPYSISLLNWITSFSEIDGVYLIVDSNPRNKQIRDIDFLLGYLKFIDALSSNGLITVLGYLNTEGLLLSLASPDIITMGSYENTRIFNIRNFEEQSSHQGGGPNARIYSPKLLQWIDYIYLGALRRNSIDIYDFFNDNTYQATMFEPSYNWHFSKPELYKHFFVEYSNQANQLTNVCGADRYIVLSSMLEEASQLNSYLKESGIVFDAASDGSHLSSWLTVANEFAKIKGWR